MEDTNNNHNELASNDRKALFASLYTSCVNGKIIHGQKVRTATAFGVAPRTVTRVWDDVNKKMEAHLIEGMSVEQLHIFNQCLERMDEEYDDSQLRRELPIAAAVSDLMDTDEEEGN